MQQSIGCYYGGSGLDITGYGIATVDLHTKYFQIIHPIVAAQTADPHSNAGAGCGKSNTVASPGSIGSHSHAGGSDAEAGGAHIQGYASGAIVFWTTQIGTEHIA